MDFPRFNCIVSGPGYGFVYLMAYPGSSKTKIGHSLDPITRATQIGGTLAPENPVLAACFWCSERRQDVEKKTHELVSSFRHNGEWYEISVEKGISIVTTAADEIGVETNLIYKRKTGRFATKAQRQAYLEEMRKRKGMK